MHLQNSVKKFEYEGFKYYGACRSCTTGRHKIWTGFYRFIKSSERVAHNLGFSIGIYRVGDKWMGLSGILVRLDPSQAVKFHFPPFPFLRDERTKLRGKNQTSI